MGCGAIPSNPCELSGWGLFLSAPVEAISKVSWLGLVSPTGYNSEKYRVTRRNLENELAGAYLHRPCQGNFESVLSGACKRRKPQPTNFQYFLDRHMEKASQGRPGEISIKLIDNQASGRRFEAVWDRDPKPTKVLWLGL